MVVSTGRITYNTRPHWWAKRNLLEEGGINHRRDHHHNSDHQLLGARGADHLSLRLLYHLFTPIQNYSRWSSGAQGTP